METKKIKCTKDDVLWAAVYVGDKDKFCKGYGSTKANAIKNLQDVSNFLKSGGAA